MKIDFRANLATAYILRGRALAASAVYVVAIGDNFDHVAGVVTLGHATNEQTRIFNQAIGDFTNAIRLDPDNTIAHFERGIAYMNIGEVDRAMADYNRAVMLNPNSARIISARGLGHRQRGEFDRAIADFHEGIRLDPNHAIVFHHRGSAHLSRGNLDPAIADRSKL
ncbi:MAG: tetratricopeptide repeat protein [Treponema sp.]|nr:tetratricopeptide repeat protein [Treponema sp.]